MRAVVLMLAVIVFAGCASNDESTANTSSSLITAEAAVANAKAEIVKRGLSLPDKHSVKVRPSFAFVELRPSRPIYVVSFSVVERGKRVALYTVVVNQRSGAIEDFTDIRRLIPAGR